MSSNKKSGQPPEPTEGWESLEEEAPTVLSPNEELEAAMREAAEAVEAVGSGSGRGRPGPAPVILDLEEPDEAKEEDGKPEAEALKDRLMRLQADFENFRRRTLKEKEESFAYGHENVVKDLLPAVDNLERAVAHARKNQGGDLEGFLQGVELVMRELASALAKHGVTQIEAEGQIFDPALHEAVAQVADGSVAPNTVTEVFEKGYRIRDRLLRPARVVVSKPPGDAKDTSQGASGTKEVDD